MSRIGVFVIYSVLVLVLFAVSITATTVVPRHSQARHSQGRGGHGHGPAHGRHAGSGLASTFSIRDDIYALRNGSSVRVKVLQNSDTGEFASVIVDGGGRTNEIWLRPKGASQPVAMLVGYGRDGDEVAANQNWKGCFLVPFANRVANGSYGFDGQSLQLPRNEASRNGSLHGYLCGQTMQVVSSEATNEHATLVLAYQIDGTYPGYPFQAYLTINYTLTAAGMFFRTTLLNTMTNGRGLPFSYGWHPYFAFDDVSTVKVQFDPCPGWLHVDMGAGAPHSGNLIPTGLTAPETRFVQPQPIGGSQTRPTYFDDEWKAAAGPSECDWIETTLAGPTSTFVLRQDRNYRFIQMYTGSMQNSNFSAIAFEPMSGMADAFNNHDHLAVLSAGERWQGDFSVHIH